MNSIHTHIYQIYRIHFNKHLIKYVLKSADIYFLEKSCLSDFETSHVNMIQCMGCGFVCDIIHTCSHNTPTNQTVTIKNL